jgi:CheY-like chemotaxis protein
LHQLIPQGSERGKPKVLVVDDDPAVHEILGPGFAGLEAELLRADDGTRGLAMARYMRPHVIVLDLRLPDLSGFEVASLLREDEITANIPVVVTTALDLTATDRERLQGLIVALHRKEPPWPDELVATVGELLARRR